MENQMLCYQCGNAKEGRCCNDTVGACGKSAETSRLQDELTGALVGLAKASVHKSIDEDIQRLMVEGLAATAAHTDFDNEQILALTEQAKAAKTKFVPKFGSYNTSLKLPEDFDIRVIWQKSPDIRSLKSLLLFGIRGIALYAHESWALGSKNKEAAGFFHKALIALGANHFKEDYYTLLDEMGGISLRAMEQANKARLNAYGSPSPVSVPRVIDPGPFIIVSGHNFEILAQILEQTKETGVNVYSHGEMLPAHAYPEFRKYPQFKGHYGTGWQNQQQEFDHIPAAIVFTSGCMDLPLPSYADRLFTAGTAYISGVPHLEQDFTPAIIAAIEQGGAPEQIAFPGVNGGTSVTTGFGRKTIRTVSYKLAAALAEGNLHHIYVVGGCDGNEANRGAYTDLIRRIPDDAVVFTWGCAKYRFNDIHYGEIDGVPRILDLGMCSDLPMVVETIEALAESAKLRVEELPLTWHYTWQGQRSTAEIFALFAADVQNVILGPALPPYFTAEVFRALAKEYNMTLFNGEASENDADAVPVAEAEPIPAEIPEETAAETEILIEEPAEEEPQKDSPYTPEELEERSEAAGLPDWAVMSEEEEAEAEAAAAEVRAEAAKAKPKIRPEDIDQSPAWLTADDDDDEDEITENIPEEPKMDIEARSEAAGLPAWAMEDNDEEENDEDDGPAVEFIVKDGKAMPVFASENTAPAEPEPTEPPKPAEPMPAKADIVLGDTAVSGGENAPKIVLPKGKGVSGWKDPDDEPSFTPGDRKPYRYTPPKELVEIPQPAPIALPAGAGISGYAADHSYDRDTADETITPLYSFAESQPEIKIPKGKGVSGWKEEDDTPRPVKRGDDSEKSGEKPWLKKSLERLHAEVEEANAPATPIPPAVPEPQPEPKEAAEPKAEAATPTETPAEPAVETDPAKPWLAASLKQLKESIEADKEAEANKNSDKPWLQASLNALHAEVEAEQNGGETPAPETNTEANDENNDEVYVSKYKHDANAAAEKPWLKTSIEELKESIDRDAGIKSVRSEKKGPAKEKTDEEVAARWQNAGERKSWKDIVPPGEKAAAAAAPVESAASSTDNTVPAAPLSGEPTDEPSGGGEPPEMWQKPKVMPKPWDKDLQTVWKKPDVLPKPWEMQQPTMYHNPDAQGNTEQVIPNIPLGNPNPRAAEEQQRAQAMAQQQAQQQAMAQQQAQQQAIAQQQAQQQAIAQQQAQQQAMAQQQAQQKAQWQAQQQALVEQQALVQQQQQAAYEAEQRALAARQDLEEQAARIRAAQAAQEAYAAQLREQAYRMEEARAQQAEAAARLAQQEQQLHAAQQQAERQVSRQSMRSRQEQAAYAAQLEQQAQQLRAAQAEQNAYRAQLEQQAAQMRAAQNAQANQAAQLAQQEQQLRQAMEQQSRRQQAFAQQQAQQQALAQQQAQQQAIAQQQQQAAPNPYQFGGNFFREEPVTLPPDAGVSGYRQTTFVPGQERPGADINDAIRTLPGVPQTAPQAIPADAGISGSHYHEELPPIMTDYTQTCYGVPQTPKVNLPQGAGVSGWNDPNPPMNAAPVQNNFFGFMNSDAPAGVRSNTEVITPGSGDEFIATKGPDGEVTVTIRSDKNK